MTNSDPVGQDPWQDGYRLGLEHGEKLAGKPTGVWLWILVGAAMVLGLEVIVGVGFFAAIYMHLDAISDDLSSLSVE